MGQSGTSTTVTQAADPWHRGITEDLYYQGRDFLNYTPYRSYPGQQVAGFQPMQLAAQDFLSRQLTGGSLPYQSPQTYGPFQAEPLQFYRGGPPPPPPPSSATAPPTQTGAFATGPGSPAAAQVYNPALGWYTPPPVTVPNNSPGLSSEQLAAQMAAPGYRPPTAMGLNQPSIPGYVWGPNGQAIPGYSTSFDGTLTSGTADMPTQQEVELWATSGGAQGRPPAAGVPVPPGGGGGMVPPIPGPPGPGQTPPGGGGMVPPIPPPPPGGGGGPGGQFIGGPGTGLFEAQQAADIARSIAMPTRGYPQVGMMMAQAERINAPQAGYGGDVNASLVSSPYAGYGGDVAAERLAGPMPVRARNVQTGNVIDAIMGYGDPYEDQVVGRALTDIDRSRQLAAQDVRAQATMAGAFGGDRSAILEAETNRAYADQAARTAGQLRSQGFERAAGLAQQDAERALRGGIANQGASLQAGLANQGAALETGRLNQAAGLQAGLANQAQRQQFGQFNAGLGLDAQQSNQAAQMQASLANQGRRQELAQFNASLGMTAAQANQAAEAQMALANQRTSLDADLANQGAFFRSGDQRLQGAGLLSSLGGDMFGRTLGTAQALSALGAEQQGQAQNVLGADMAQFYDAQNDPYRRFGFLQGLLTGVPQNMTQTSYVPGNRGAGFLGGAASGAGIGSYFSPGWGTAIGAGLGGLLGLF